jgi:hypothetical protein
MKIRTNLLPTVRVKNNQTDVNIDVEVHHQVVNIPLCLIFPKGYDMLSGILTVTREPGNVPMICDEDYLQKKISLSSSQEEIHLIFNRMTHRESYLRIAWSSYDVHSALNVRIISQHQAIHMLRRGHGRRECGLKKTRQKINTYDF